MSDSTLTDYDSLVAEVKLWCARSDSTFSNRFPAFLGLVESRIYTGHGQPGDPLYTAPLRTKVMETSGTVTLSGGSGSLPSNALNLRRVYRDTDQIGLTFASPALFSTMNATAVAGSDPYYYTTEGSLLRVTPTWDGPVGVLYYQRFEPITVANKTGTLLSEHSLVYFKALMFYAYAFMQETDQAAAWLGELRAAIDGANRVANDIRSGAQRMRSIAKAIG